MIREKSSAEEDLVAVVCAACQIHLPPNPPPSNPLSSTIALPFPSHHLRCGPESISHEARDRQPTRPSQKPAVPEQKGPTKPAKQGKRVNKNPKMQRDKTAKHANLYHYHLFISAAAGGQTTKKGTSVKKKQKTHTQHQP